MGAMRALCAVALLLTTGCTRAGFDPSGPASGDSPAHDGVTPLTDGIQLPTETGARDLRAADLLLGDGTSAGGSHDCADPVRVDMAQPPAILHLDFSSAGCFYPGLTMCDCYTARQMVLRVVNNQGKKVDVKCTGSAGYDKVYIQSELGSAQCPPQAPQLSSMTCGPTGSTISHGYGEYLIVCRRNIDPPTATLVVTFD
jgi:hypothetical protein